VRDNGYVELLLSSSSLFSFLYFESIKIATNQRCRPQEEYYQITPRPPHSSPQSAVKRFCDERCKFVLDL
jgi:hypothetical protein